jgi:hypothetical protein
MTTEANAPTEWEETNVDAAEAAYKKWEAAKGRAFAKRPPAGRSVWRFLPPIKGSGGDPFYQVWVHMVKNASGDIVASGLCPSKMGTGNCVVCPEVARLKRTGLPADKDRADDMRAQFDVYANAVNLEEDDPKVQVLRVPQGVYKTLAQLLKDAVAGGDFTHPDKGYNIVITKTGSGRNDTEYDAVPARNSSVIMNRGWLGKMNNLAEAAGLLDTAFVKAVFSGEALPASSEAAPAAAGRQLPPAEAPAGAPPQDMVEDPITGKWIPKSMLAKPAGK